MPRGQHSLESTKLPRRRLALLTAPLVTVLAVGLGVTTSGYQAPAEPPMATAELGAGLMGSTSTSAEGRTAETRTLGTSRSAERVPLVNNRVPKAKGKLWATSDLDLRVEPKAKTRTTGLLDAGKQIPVTGRRQGAFAEVISNKVTRWVTADYLSEKKEVQPGSLGLVDRPCAATQGVESGLTSSAVRVYRAVCNNFPEIASYGGLAPRGEHGTGRAIDIMTSDQALGDRIAAFLQTNASALNLFDVIWAQRIWTPVRAGEGWRSMPSRGSATANHFDHVHVSVN